MQVYDPSDIKEPMADLQSCALGLQTDFNLKNEALRLALYRQNLNFWAWVLQGLSNVKHINRY